MSIEAVVFYESNEITIADTKKVEAIVDFNEFDQPFSVEVLGLKFQIGDATSTGVFAALKKRSFSFSYDEDVDALTFSFGDGTRSLGQRIGVLEIGIKGDDVVLKLSF